MQEIKEKVRRFVVENFLFGNQNGLEEDSSFLEEGIVDSTGILELVDFIEKEYGIKVEDDDLIPEYLDSIANVAAYIGGKTAQD